MAKDRSYQRVVKRVRFADIQDDGVTATFRTSELTIQTEQEEVRSEAVDWNAGGLLIGRYMDFNGDEVQEECQPQEEMEELSRREALSRARHLIDEAEELLGERHKLPRKATRTTTARAKIDLLRGKPGRIAKGILKVQSKRKVSMRLDRATNSRNHHRNMLRMNCFDADFSCRQQPLSAIRKKALEELAMSMSSNDRRGFLRIEKLSVEFQVLLIGMEGSGSMDKMFD